MYSEKTIKTALETYIASNGDMSIDKQGIIGILDQGADRNFDSASKTIKAVRVNYGEKSRIPEWLRMLAFRLVYDCMASDAEYNSEMAWYEIWTQAERNLLRRQQQRKLQIKRKKLRILAI